MRRLLLVLLVLALAVPAVAGAQDNPFGPLPQAAQPTPTPTAAPSSSTQDSVSRGLLFGIAGGVALIFVGIGWFITRDARANLTEADRRALETGRTIDGSEEERRRTKVAKSKARAAGKRQRQARKAQRRR